MDFKKATSSFKGNGLVLALAYATIGWLSGSLAKVIFRKQVDGDIPEAEKKLADGRQWQSVVFTTLITGIISSLLQLLFAQFVLRFKNRL